MGHLNLLIIMKWFILSVISWPTCEWHHPDRLTATCPTLFNQADVANLENTSIWHRTTSVPWQIRTIRQLLGHLVTSLKSSFLKFRIRIKLSFIMSFTEKVFVHEWSHLRYGVFDEYGYQGDTKYPLFYKKPGANAIQVNLCTNNPPIFTTKLVDYTSILIFFASTNY